MNIWVYVSEYMYVSIIIPLVAWALFFVYRLCKDHDWRTAFLVTTIAWGVALTLLTEFLSFFSILNRPCLATGWMALAIASGVLVFRAEPIPKFPTLATLPRTDKYMVLSIVGILLCTFVIAVVSPPNNWDSMTYHMSRVMHWMQNQSVRHYPTNITMQIELNPWAEFAITNLQILIGGDYLANLVQWFSMAGSILGVSLIAGRLGANRNGQTFAAVVVATIPMGILQSSSTQNDVVVSLWLVCLVYFGIRFNEKPSWSYASIVGASLGLALLTKGTAYIYAFPLLIWFTIYPLKRIKLAAVKYIAIISLVAVLLNVGHCNRNYEVFGNILSSGPTKFFNDVQGFAFLFSNITRNLALGAATPFNNVNYMIKSGVERLHTSLGLDINDRRTTLVKFDVNRSIHEDNVGNPFHLLLIVFSTVMVCCIKKIRDTQNVFPYLFILIMAFIFFCFLKWQPWHNRLLLPLFILWSPIVALVVAEIKPLGVINSISITICAMALPYLLFNASRPLITNPKKTKGHIKSIFTSERKSQYFNNRPDLMQTYLEIAQHLKNINCNSVAIQTAKNTWEYPLWVFMQENSIQNIRIEHINVGNLSGNIPLNNFTYCYMLSLR